MWTERHVGRVVVARFSRPPMSYFTDEDIEQLEDLVARWASPDVGAVVLAGGLPGKFITHFDVDSILLKQEQPEGPVEAPVRSRRYHALTRSLNELPKPVIAALNGDAMGGGFELALACDIRIGEHGDYRYGLPEVRLGIVPGGSGLTRLARLVGPGRALALGLQAKVHTPEDAYRLGMVEELADDAVAAATELCARITELTPSAVAMAKRIVYQTVGLPLAVALELELESTYRAKQSPDAAAPMREYLALPLEQRRAWLER
jgi:enoyl-CoA hydratase/carnithine racemase